ncbi:hypothetical protein HF086_011738 [Spodoptera exigua]|uniref:Dymeclin n=1 Tax=Spodoptera exigua TaxID=7107 RepID=A0A922SFX6_SPOEX|nr:hypothetical protein HF086_011738 [Spodoptera exigua]
MRWRPIQAPDAGCWLVPVAQVVNELMRKWCGDINNLELPHITEEKTEEIVIGYFSTRLQRVQEGAGGDLGVNEVLQCIKKGAEQWSSDRLKKFPDLKFRYVEEERPEEFFTPYVWSLVNSCGGVYWASEGGARALGDLLAC